MGRRSRHKKIKSCDPFYKGPKAQTASNPENLNFITSKAGLDEQKPPRKARDLMKQPLHQTKKVQRKPGLKSQNTKLKTNLRFQRKPGESKKEYFSRIDHEAALAMAKSMMEDRKSSDRRKKHLKDRKEKLQEKRRKQLEKDADFDSMKDDVKFGEVAHQPPALPVKPRKAPQNKGSKSLLLHSLVASKTSQTGVLSSPQDKSGPPKAKRRKHMTPQEQAAMDKERERVILAYRMAKKQEMEKKSGAMGAVK